MWSGVIDWEIFSLFNNFCVMCDKCSSDILVFSGRHPHLSIIIKKSVHEKSILVVGLMHGPIWTLQT
jgi:hypothetical protein